MVVPLACARARNAKSLSAMHVPWPKHRALERTAGVAPLVSVKVAFAQNQKILPVCLDRNISIKWTMMVVQSMNAEVSRAPNRQLQNAHLHRSS